MALTFQARAALALSTALTRVGLMPDMAKALTAPVAKRLALKPPKGLLGAVAEAVVEDRVLEARDGALLRVRVYRPVGAPSGVPVLYAHGGGFVVGGLASCDHICRRIAADSGAVVASVEYRLAPEHPFPGPLHDMADAAAWLLSHAAELGADPARLVVAGDSAGGNLAAALSLVLREQGTPLAGQVLIYPTVDLTTSGPGLRDYAGPGLTAQDCRECAERYLAGHDPADPLASPLHAATFAGLPATLVVTVEHDPLREEGRLYVARCLADGVAVQHLDVADQVHGSLSLPRLYRGIDDVYRTVAAFLSERAGATPVEGAEPRSRQA